MSDDMFDDVEDAEDKGVGEVITNDEPKLSGTDTPSLMEWLKDLTYNEVHAMTLGFCLTGIGMALFPLVAGKLLLSVFVLLVVGITSARIKPAVAYVVKEPHYYLALGFVGLLVGAGVQLLVV